jgi:hypothetical protein
MDQVVGAQQISYPRDPAHTTEGRLLALAVKSATVSLPNPPAIGPNTKVSAPPSPSSVSLPAPPIRRSDPPLSKSVSVPDPPVKVLAKELPGGAHRLSRALRPTHRTADRSLPLLRRPHGRGRLHGAHAAQLISISSPTNPQAFRRIAIRQSDRSRAVWRGCVRTPLDACADLSVRGPHLKLAA